MPVRRTAAVVAVALATFASGPVALAEPATPPATEPVEVAAGWLARQLVDGDHFEGVFDGRAFPDQGLTLDAGFAFTAAGVARDRVDAAAAWLARPEVISNYLYYNDPEKASFAGPHAKLALFAQVIGEDPEDFGGVDLLAGLTALKSASGRFSDRSEFGDLSNGFSQAFAVLALDRAGGAPADAVDYLVGGRCADGGFPLVLEADTCESHVDATAMAAQALLATGRAADAAGALDWLVSAQRPGGGFRDEDAAEGNANSTGLAAQALLAGGRTSAADRAVAFLRSLQVGCGGPEAQRGAIAFDRTGFAASNATRATSQGVLGLVGVGFAELSAEGDRPGAPALDCTDVPTSSATTTTTATSTSDSAAPTTAPSTTSVGGTTTTTANVVVVAGSGTGLANTGASVGPALWVGSLALVGGALLLVLSRRRHVPAEERG